MKTCKILAVSMLIFTLIAINTGCGNSGKAQRSLTAAAAAAVITAASASIPAATVIVENTIIMTGRGFQPAEITIQKGETITWTNSAADNCDVVGSAFKSDPIEKDGTFSQVFTQTGIYDYKSSVNTDMMGRIIVK